MPHDLPGKNLNPPPRSLRRAGRWAIAGLLAAAAAVLSIQAALNTAAAQNQPAVAESPGILILGGQVSRDTYGLYMVDMQNRTICVYQYLPSTQKLKLLASRNFSYDVRLDDYNTDPPPRDIRQMVEEHKRIDQP